MTQETSITHSQMTIFFFGNHGLVLKSITELFEPEDFSVVHFYTKDLPDYINKINCDSVIYTIGGALLETDLENLKLLKKQNDLLPVIIISNDSRKETETKVREQGIMFFFTEPYEKKHLFSIIKSGSELYRRKTQLYGRI